MVISTINSQIKSLKIAGLKVTPARLGVLNALSDNTLPLDITEIMKYLNVNKIKADKATVFRTVKTLVAHKLIIPVQLHEGKFRYELAGEQDHHHFVCDRCGNISDIFECNVSQMEKEMEKNLSIKVRKHSLEFFGLCRKCL